jgi:hypothetical protein
MRILIIIVAMLAIAKPAWAEERLTKQADIMLFYSSLSQVIAGQETCGYHLHTDRLENHVAAKVDPENEAYAELLETMTESATTLQESLSDDDLYDQCAVHVLYAMSNGLALPRDVPGILGGARDMEPTELTVANRHIKRLGALTAGQKICGLRYDKQQLGRLLFLLIPDYTFQQIDEVISEGWETTKSVNKNGPADKDRFCDRTRYAAYIAGLIDSHEIATSEASQ